MDQLLTRESLAVYFPLLVFLAVTAYRELATQRIANNWLLPGLIYFSIARLVVGPNAVTDYLGGSLQACGCCGCSAFWVAAR